MFPELPLAAFLAVILAAGAGWPARHGGGSDMKAAAQRPKTVSPSCRVSIETGFALAGGQLEIRYTVENRRLGDIWLLDIEETTSPPYYVPRSPRVELESPATAVLACWWEYQPPPPGITWVTPPVFYGPRVAAGRKYSATMRVRLPLSPGRSGRAVECTMARFELAAILDTPEVRAVEMDGRNMGRFWLTAMETQKVLRARARPLRVAVGPAPPER